VACETEGPQVIQYIINNEPPAKVCAALSFCPNSTKADSVECTVCQFLIQEVETYVSQGETEAEIVTDLDNLCSAFGSTISPVCTTVVNTYTGQMIQWIVNKENPQTFCSSCALCSA
jgi:saposin